MMRINLLPHRQQRRAQQQREFEGMLLLAVVATAGLLFAAWAYVGAGLEQQAKRNQRLSDEIAALERKIASIQTLKTQIQLVLDRKDIVETLQQNRNQAVGLMDELARLCPEGLYYRGIKQVGDSIELRGVADTNTRIAALVHRLGASARMHDPNLLEIKAVEPAPGLRQFEFLLKVGVTRSVSSGSTGVTPAPTGQAG